LIDVVHVGWSFLVGLFVLRYGVRLIFNQVFLEATEGPFMPAVLMPILAPIASCNCHAKRMLGRVDFNYYVIKCGTMRHLEVLANLVPADFIVHVGWSFLVGGY
jgi:hypothetical protein